MTRKAKIRDWLWAVKDGDTGSILIFTKQGEPMLAQADWGSFSWKQDGEYPSFEFCVRAAKRAVSGLEKIGREPVKVRFSVEIAKEKAPKSTPKPRSKAR